MKAAFIYAFHIEISQCDNCNIDVCRSEDILWIVKNA